MRLVAGKFSSDQNFCEIPGLLIVNLNMTLNIKTNNRCIDTLTVDKEHYTQRAEKGRKGKTLKH
jgi:hypothetical protein